MSEFDKQKIETTIGVFLRLFGCDLNHPDLKDTPERVARLWAEEMDNSPPKGLFKTFPSDYNSAITLVNHRTYTRCPHHLERVIMDVSVSYIPNGQLLGLSKLGRIADYYSKGLMLQEEIAEMVVEGLEKALEPKGVAVHIIGRHMCMQARGLKSHNSKVVTTRLKGVFLDDIKAREEFFWTIKEG